jgi:hypothetical protein
MPGSFTANGTIRPSRFVKFDTSGPGLVLEADAGEAVVGISGPGTRFVPWSELDDGNHAIAGENCQVFQDGHKRIMLELGGTVDEGSFLKSDADGKGVAATADQEKYGARARVAGVSGEIIEVDVMIGERSTT